jgi:hypothetical protein
MNTDPLESEDLGPEPATTSSVGVRGAACARPDSPPRPAPGAGSALRSTLPLGVSGSAASGTNADGTMYSGSVPPQGRPQRLAARLRLPPRLGHHVADQPCPPSRPRTPRRRPRTAGCAPSAASTSPSSTRCPRTFTWSSTRPRHSSRPVGQPPGPVARAVQPPPGGPKGSGTNRSAVSPGAPGSPRARPDAPQVQLAGDPHRRRPQAGVEHVGAQPASGPADGHRAGPGADRLGGGPDGRLGGAVEVPEPAARSPAGGRPARGAAPRRRRAWPARAPGPARPPGASARWPGWPAGAWRRSLQQGGQGDAVGGGAAGEGDAAPDGQGQEELQRGDVEGERGDGQEGVAAADAEGGRWRRGSWPGRRLGIMTPLGGPSSPTCISRTPDRRHHSGSSPASGPSRIPDPYPGIGP